jgi:glycosyltransferase involved in cell wall biosynthesis
MPGTVDRVRSRLGVGPRPERDAVGITWDENAAYRMATVRPHERHVSGVIWLTDAAARGRDVGRLPSVLARCAALWVLSDAQIEPVRRLVPGARVEYVRFGVDPGFFAARPYPEAARVVSVGGDRDRDTETLYRALARVHEKRPDAELVVQTASDLPAPDGVERIRHLPHAELRDLYASATVVAIATRPNLHVSGMTVSLEAMSTARPVAVTRSPGMHDYVVEGETGLLSGQGDDEALAANILALLGDRERAQGIGEAGRRVVEARHTTQALAAAIHEIAISAR